MDIVDQAQAREEMDRKIALAAQQARIDESFAPRDPKIATFCIECDESIEPERLRVLVSTARCAACAHLFEQRHRRP